MKAVKFILLVVILLNSFLGNAQSDSSFYNKKYGYKSYVIPAALVIYGLTNFNNNGFPSSQTIKEYRNKNFADFNNSADDYLVFAPEVILLGLDLLKYKSSSNFANQTAITAKSVALCLGVVNILKYSTQVTRPDNSANNSFPSGHTAFAFTLAEVLHQEFKNKPLIYLTGYTIATTAATMRILNNKHWFTDVLVGAGIGMAATKLIYATHQYKWKMNNKGFIPIIGSNQAGFIYKF